MIREKISELSKNMKEDHISESSAQCAYYTILSFIPFIMLVITLIQYTRVEPQTLFDVISKIIPSSMSEMILGIVQEVYSKSIGTISISVIFTIWAAGKGLYALTKGLQIVYNTDDKEETSYLYTRVKAVIETIVFIVLIVMGLTLLVFGNGIISIIKEKFGTLENYNLISSIATEIGLIFVTFIVFILLYKFMPKHKMALKTQVYGAIFGAIALNVISFVFSRYLTIFKGFSITYGSLTTVMLIMMWTYSCFYALFLGAELNKILNQKKEN
jgi:YihY family inner membrane protein